VEAGFSRDQPNDILSGQSTRQGNTYYNFKLWAQTRDADGQLPLLSAARKSLKWYYMKQIFMANMPVINEIDPLSGLPLFLIAAAGPSSNIESVYNLLHEFPGAMSFNESQLLTNISNESTRKRKRR